jgi:peptidoglycan/LPS O-acetylase OafA/YrhL
MTFMPSLKNPQTLASAYRPEANNLNLVRLLLALAVIASHSYPIVFGLGPGDEAEPLARLTHHRTNLGAVAVDGFFAVSGFLLTASWLRRKGVGDFVRRRFLRIYPGFFVCLVAGVALLGPLSGVPARTYFGNPETYRPLRYLYFGRLFTGMPGVFNDNPLPGIANSPVWTIKYEVYCYALLIAWGSARLLRPWPTLVLAFACLTAYTVLDQLGLNLPLAMAPDYLPRLTAFFFGGAALYLWRDRVPVHPGLFAVAATTVAVTSRLWFWPSLVLATAGIYALFYLGTIRWGPTNAVGRRNDLSYGTYLYAWPIQQLLLKWGLGRGHPWLLTTTTVPAVLAIAAISWFAVERPALRLKGGGRHAAPSVVSPIALDV